MTGSDDSHSNTRPISVAELLAKNGSIGAPPVSGRRRRRRGNADAVSVAELTGEMPVIRLDDPDPSAVTAAVEEQVTEVGGAADQLDDMPDAATDGAITEVPEPDTAENTRQDPDVDNEEAVAEVPAGDSAPGADVDDDYADAVAEYAAHVEHRGDEPDPADAAPPPRRFGFGRPSSKKSKKSKESLGSPESQELVESRESVVADAATMSPDPPEGGTETDVVDSPAVAAINIADLDIDDLDDQAAPDAGDSDELPSYLRSTQEPLFSGQTVADDVARRGGTTPVSGERILDEVEDRDDEEAAEYGEPGRMSSFVTGLWIVGQSIIAVMFGAGLFIAFDQLWKWNNIVALVLSVLVILGLVVAVRVVRKTEDIGSTLIAVAVGALVTLGPLALLQSG